MNIKRVSKYILNIILIFVLYFPNTVNASGTSSTIRIKELDKSKKDYYINEFSTINATYEMKELEENFIYSFDVSKDQKCAVFLDNAVVAVIDSDGQLDKTISFSETIINTKKSSDTVIRWNGENIDLLMSYGIICSFTTEGKIIDIVAYETDLTSLPKPEKITVGDYVYELKYSNFMTHFLGGNRYDTITRSYRSNDEEIVFKSSKTIPDVIIGLFVFVGLFTGAFIFVAVYWIIYKKRRNYTT